MTSHPLGGNVESGMCDMYRSLSLSTPTQPNRVPFSKFLATLDTSKPIMLARPQSRRRLDHLHRCRHRTAAQATVHIEPADLQHRLAARRRPGVRQRFQCGGDHNFRIYNIRDYVPTVPPEELGYVHVNTALPQPELDSWQYPIYHGWDPIKAAGCYHSHAGYNYMLTALAGITPNTGELGSCYAPQTRTTSVQFTRASNAARGCGLSVCQR